MSKKTELYGRNGARRFFLASGRKIVARRGKVWWVHPAGNLICSRWGRYTLLGIRPDQTFPIPEDLRRRYLCNNQ